MHQAEDNQSQAAEWLGLNRNTLRKKLIEHKCSQIRLSVTKPPVYRPRP